jgi:hypothetical protein
MINGDRSPLEISKRWGALYIVNTLLKINFQVRQQNLAKKQMLPETDNEERLRQ